MEKIDYKKEYKDLYLPKTKPMLIDVPKKKQKKFLAYLITGQIFIKY